MSPAIGEPGCTLSNPGTLQPGNPARGTCSTVTWGWNFTVACKHNNELTFEPPGTCFSKQANVTISGVDPDGNRFPEDIFVGYDVRFTDECCNIEPCSAKIDAFQAKVRNGS